MSELSYVKKNYISFINRVIENNKVSHAYLVEVDNYDSDYDYILSFIKMILTNKTFEMLDKSDKVSSMIDSGNYPDLSIISSDTSVIKKALLIDLQKEFNNKSLYGSKKIYIIKEAEKLNDSSANTILKFLEEPEDNIIAFLITNNRFHVIDTIISRCQVISLKENKYDIVFDDSLLDLLDCVLNPCNFFINYNQLIKNSYSDKLMMKNKLIEVENIILAYLSNSDIDDNILFLLKKKNNIDLINMVSIIEDELPKLEFNINYKLWLDSLFSRLIGG